MSVNMLVHYTNRPDLDNSEMIPVSGERTFREVWEPIIRELNLKLLSQAADWMVTVIPPFDDFLAEWGILRDHFKTLAENHPDKDLYPYLQEKCDRIIEYLKFFTSEMGEVTNITMG